MASASLLCCTGCPQVQYRAAQRGLRTRTSDGNAGTGSGIRADMPLPKSSMSGAGAYLNGH